MGAERDTVVMFLSDNGASSEQLIRGDGHDSAAPLGSARTFLGLGPGWASCSNSAVPPAQVVGERGRHRVAADRALAERHHGPEPAAPRSVPLRRRRADAGGSRRRQRPVCREVRR